jgi:hypothetical protein
MTDKLISDKLIWNSDVNTETDLWSTGYKIIYTDGNHIYIFVHPFLVFSVQAGHGISGELLN